MKPHQNKPIKENDETILKLPVNFGDVLYDIMPIIGKKDEYEIVEHPPIEVIKATINENGAVYEFFCVDFLGKLQFISNSNYLHSFTHTSREKAEKASKNVRQL